MIVGNKEKDNEEEEREDNNNDGVVMKMMIIEKHNGAFHMSVTGALCHHVLSKAVTTQKSAAPCDLCFSPQLMLTLLAGSSPRLTTHSWLEQM
eukprot:269292-Pelagomonas_calceolata.AAC.1